MQTLTAPAQVTQPQYEITEADKARVQRILDARAAYDGDLTPPLKKMPDGRDPNVMDNICAPPVDGGLAFLFDEEVDITIEQGGPQEAQDFLDAVWGEKEQRIPLLQELGMNGAIAGQAFLRIVPNPDKTFRLIAVDPATVFVRTMSQDCRTVMLYCIEYCTDEKRNGKPVRVFYREEISKIDPDQGQETMMEDTDATWQIQHWSREGERGPWIPAGEPIVWSYPFAPLFSNQNLTKPNDFWGTPDITPILIKINNAINFALSNINKVGELYGHPILYAPGTGNTTLDLSPGRIIQLPLPENSIQSVPITSDLANMLLFVDKLYAAAERITAVPALAQGLTAQMQRGVASGLAIKMMCLSLLKKTSKKRCLYGKLLLDVSKALLMLNNFSKDIKMSLDWISPLPADDLSDLQAMQLKLAAGVSKRTAFSEQGYDYDEEASQKAEEDAQAMLNSSRGQGFPSPMPMDQSQQGQPPQDQGMQNMMGGQ